MLPDHTLSPALPADGSTNSKEWANSVTENGKTALAELFRKKVSKTAWQIELNKKAARYHFTAAWVGVIFNLVFSLADYLNSPQFWFNFMTVRASVSCIIFIGIILYLKKIIDSKAVLFIAILGISLQNAYMWSLMDVGLLQKHTLAYIALFIGAGMLVVWEMKYTITLVAISLIANVLAFSVNSSLSVNEIMASGGILTLSVAVFSILLIQTRYKLNKKEIISRLALEKANVDILEQKRLVEKKQTHITESIEYAKTIQDAMLPAMKRVQEILPKCRIFYRPLDIVSGDFYWCEQVGDKIVIAAVDCTGHGVPGALMSMIGTTLLNETVKVKEVTSPGLILDSLREGVNRLLCKDEDNNRSDSMDIALCTIDLSEKTVTYAGAYNPLYHFRKGELMETKADKMPIGYSEHSSKASYTEHTARFESGDMVYIFSDGFADQFGGPKDKKYSSRRMKKFLQSISYLDVSLQLSKIEDEFDLWKGEAEQLDDVLMISIKL